MVGRLDIFVLRVRVLWDRWVVGEKDLEVRKGGGTDVEKIWRRVLVVRVCSIHFSTCAV